MCPIAVESGNQDQERLGSGNVSVITPTNSLGLFLRNSSSLSHPDSRLTFSNSRSSSFESETSLSRSSTLESAELFVFPNCSLSTLPQSPCCCSQTGNSNGYIDCASNSSSSPVDSNFAEVMVVTAPINNPITSPPASSEHFKAVVNDTEESVKHSLSFIASPSQHQPTSPRFSITTIEDSQPPLNEPSTPVESIPVIYHRSSVVASPQSTIISQSAPNPVASPCVPPMHQTSPPPPVIHAPVLPTLTSLTEPITEPMTTMSIQEDEESHPLPRKADPERVLEYGGPNNRYAKVRTTFVM
jgi:hypothetical protein